MRIETTVKSLAAALAAVKPAIETKSSIPILHYVMFADGRMTATDLQIGIVLPIPGTSEGDAICIDHKPLSDALKGLPKASTVVLDDAILTCGSVSVKLPTMSRESYPELPTNLTITGQMPAASIMRMIRETRFAISPEDNRFTINGALLEGLGESVRMVATDGHRLSKSDVSGELPSGFKAILPTSGIVAMSKLWAKSAGLIVIGSDKNHVTFADDHGVEVVMRKLEGNFPDYERVLPRVAPQTIRLTVNRPALLTSIGRAMQSADKRTKAVTLVLNGCCKVTATDGERSYSEDVEASWSGPEDFKVGINGLYLTDALGCIDDETVTFETRPTVPHFEGDKRDLLVCDCAVAMRLDSSMHVIMPMRA